MKQNDKRYQPQYVKKKLKALLKILEVYQSTLRSK